MDLSENPYPKIVMSDRHRKPRIRVLWFVVIAEFSVRSMSGLLITIFVS
jgi:hypothetical protein